MTSRRSARLLARAASPVSAPKASKVVKKPKAPKAPKKPVVRAAASAPASAAVPGQLLIKSGTPMIHATLADPGVMDEAIRYLKEADLNLGRIIDQTTEKCPMSLARDEESDTSFVSLCKSIIFQQLAGSAARAILLRFLKRYGTLRDASKAPMLADDSSAALAPDDFEFPSAHAILAMDVGEMKAVGLGQRKAEYLQAVAAQFNSGALTEELLLGMADDDVSRALVSIRGIGQWTADMFLMFHLKRPDVLPTLDLAVRKAMCHHFRVPFGKKTPTHEHMVEMASAWAPYRSVATWYMWRLAGTITQKSK
ncbi:hypothetical protein GGF43_003514 [Coemansia sp. RSA 2618]|nr:hypothetical protein GGF43_003514 [Coemansia sp. RSA 2618]